MNQEKEMTEQESMMIIARMIHTAKREQKDNGKGWILWGWMLFIVSVLTIVNIHQHWVDTWTFWNFFGLFTVVMMIYSIARRISHKQVRVKTYTNELFIKLNIGFFISIIFISVAMNVQKITPQAGFSLLIDLYGFWILIYGASLDFKPSIVAAFLVWGIGIGSLFTHSFETVMSCHAAAVLVGYIIPGHIANREFNKIRR